VVIAQRLGQLRMKAGGSAVYYGLGLSCGLISWVGCQSMGSVIPGASVPAPYGSVPPAVVAVNIPPPEPTMTQGVHVPVGNQDLAWEKIVDIVDDYFRIERERPVQLVGQVMTEGRIDTYPQTGASVLEPYLADSVGWDNRWESTFQTIRRQAVVRVIPDETGYLIDVVVQKELEDLPQPEHATARSTSFSGTSAIPSRRREVVSRTRYARHWIPLGRDTILEQQMLNAFGACLSPQP
jgi:hypothetical protein